MATPRMTRNSASMQSLQVTRVKNKIGKYGHDDACRSRGHQKKNFLRWHERYSTSSVHFFAREHRFWPMMPEREGSLGPVVCVCWCVWVCRESVIGSVDPPRDNQQYKIVWDVDGMSTM